MIRRSALTFLFALTLAALPELAAAQDAGALGAPETAPPEAAQPEAAVAPAAPTIVVVPVAPTEAAVPPPPPSAYAPTGPVIVQSAPLVLDRAPLPPTERGYAPTWGLFIPGIAMFGATYIPAVLAGIEVDIAYSGSGEVTGWLYVPALGPFVLAGYADGSPWAQGLFVALGVVQTAGLTLTILGLALNSRPEISDGGVTVSMLPLVSPELSGVAMAGSF